MQRNLYRHCKINNYLVINDMFFPSKENKYYKIDTLLFGNKYIYLIFERKLFGKIIINEEDYKFRVINKDTLKLIDNEFIKCHQIIDRFTKTVSGVNNDDFKCIMMFTNTVEIEGKISNNRDFTLNEKETFKKILEIENESTKKEIPYDVQEKYARAFYLEGLRAQEELKMSQEENK